MDPAAQNPSEALTTQSSSAQARMILAALSLLQRHLKEWPLLNHFPFFLETHAPPLLRCAATVALSADQVSVRWPFFGSASLNPQSGHMFFPPSSTPRTLSIGPSPAPGLSSHRYRSLTHPKTSSALPRKKRRKPRRQSVAKVSSNPPPASSRSSFLRATRSHGDLLRSPHSQLSNPSH